MKKKIGRNDLCYCGSGKKYKKCCMDDIDSSNDMSSNLVYLGLRRIQKTEEDLVSSNLLPFVERNFSDAIFLVAMDYLLLLSNFAPEELEMIDRSFFITWFLFDWRLDLDSKEYKEVVSSKLKKDLDRFELSKNTIVSLYMRERPFLLSQEQRSFIEACESSHYSFYKIKEIKSQKKVLLTDLILGIDKETIDENITIEAQKGDIICCKLINIGDYTVIFNVMPFTLRNVLPQIQDLRTMIESSHKAPITSDILREDHEMEILDLCISICSSGHKNSNIPGIELHNTDGDLYLPYTSRYKVDISIEEIIFKLAYLSLEGYDDIIELSQRNKNGEITYAEFSWTKKGNKIYRTWDNTILGTISIIPGEIRAEFNSKERANMFDKIIKEELHESVKDSKTQPGYDYNQSSILDHNSFKEIFNDKEGILNDLDIKRHLRNMAEEYYKSWCDTAMPALDDKTPRDALKSKSGKEKLEALLKEFELENQRINRADDIFKPNIKLIREELGI